MANRNCGVLGFGSRFEDKLSQFSVELSLGKGREFKIQYIRPLSRNRVSCEFLNPQNWHTKYSNYDACGVCHCQCSRRRLNDEEICTEFTQCAAITENWQWRRNILHAKAALSREWMNNGDERTKYVIIPKYSSRQEIIKSNVLDIINESNYRRTGGRAFVNARVWIHICMSS